MRKLGIGAALLGAALAASALAVAEDFSWQGRLAPGATLEVKGVNGRVEAVGVAGAQASVKATKTARRSDPDAVEIKLVEHAGGVTICAVYPTPSDSRHANECEPGDGGHMSTRDNDVQVDFEVGVPAGVRFAGRTVNGAVEAKGLDADAEASTVNGSVTVETRGHARAETVNGSITASMGRAEWSGSVEFHTVNGSIRLELPADLNADVSAETVNGGIDSDFPLTVRGKFSRRSLKGTIGSGGRQLDLETVNGGIHLRKAG